jgi:glutamyl/glutaminyl-tRNA synthetase
VIRGDDHLNNAFRQLQIIKAMGWPEPVYAHIPLIHGPDGAKLSKRHGALGVDAYRDMGFLPAALRNYLLRLGWGHGDDEIISTEQAIEWFDLSGVGRSASRFDLAKLTNLNAHYLRETPDAELMPMVAAAHRGEDRRQDRRGRPAAHPARHDGSQAALTHPGRARGQPGLLCQERRPADRRRQGARPAHSGRKGAARQARLGARG